MTPKIYPQIHENDIGTRFRFRVRHSKHRLYDISLATGVSLHFRRPDRTSFIVLAELEEASDSLLAPGAEGVFYYDTVDGDLVPTGDWYVQGYIVFPDDRAWNTSIVHFRVYPNLISAVEP